MYKINRKKTTHRTPFQINGIDWTTSIFEINACFAPQKIAVIDWQLNFSLITSKFSNKLFIFIGTILCDP